MLFVAAADDAITPLTEHQRPMFEAKATGPAQLRTIVGASHCGFLDLETVLLRLVCDEAAIGPDEQRRVTRAVLAAWLRYELAGDASAAALAWPEAPDDFHPGRGALRRASVQDSPGSSRRSSAASMS